jgi:RimJ/RimL family protein N-acetyltransferase
MEPTLRPVGEDDMRRLWEWSNDPEVRRQSFDSAPIEWDDHVSWFMAQRRDPRSSIFVVESPLGEPVGVVRFAADADKAAVIGVAIDPSARGSGVGSKAIRAACIRMKDDGVAPIFAFVKPDNASSIRAFTHAGFVPTDARSHAGALALEWDGDGE